MTVIEVLNLSYLVMDSVERLALLLLSLICGSSSSNPWFRLGQDNLSRLSLTCLVHQDKDASFEWSLAFYCLDKHSNEHQPKIRAAIQFIPQA